MLCFMYLAYFNIAIHGYWIPAIPAGMTAYPYVYSYKFLNLMAVTAYPTKA